MNTNLLLMVDSYKASHYLAYPPDTKFVYSYIESRGGRWPHTLVFGLQAFIKEYLLKPITKENIEEATDFFAMHGEPFNTEGWNYILNEHGGFLPLDIKQVDEGTLVPTHNVLCTVVNTDSKCFWLTSYMETAILRSIWYPTTIATNSFACKVHILKALMKSSDENLAQVIFKLHDFGGRGVSSAESAALGGMAHLVNFMGSDTVEGVMAARRYYDEPMAAFSIPAAEHSTITAWGKDHEVEAYRNMLKQFAKPSALVAVVSDSYDLMNAVENIWGKTLKQEVIESGATIIIRPDSGNPEIIPIDTVLALSKSFGFTVNSKGYKVLPSCVRVIQGDGINEISISKILENLLAAGFSADNIAFGMGGALLQQVDRDTLKFAMKASAIYIGEWHVSNWRDVYKEPKTDPNKNSKRGHLALVRDQTGFATVRSRFSDDLTLPIQPEDDLLRTVFCDGLLVVNHKFADIREKAHQAALTEALKE